MSSYILVQEEEETTTEHPGGIVLKRSGYYTIPPLKDIQVKNKIL